MDNTTSGFYFAHLSDPRTSGWFLIGSPVPMYLILVFYLYFVKVFGPNYMKDKKPFQLKRVIRIYNLLQVAANVWMFKEAVLFWSTFNWNCQPVDYTYSAMGMRQAWACYCYFLNKISDLADTVFFVLRKKDKQITFLHVFHHTLMPFATWHVVRFFPGGHGTFIGLVNTFVHILLYLYYYLAAFGPKVQKYLWWKKYLTRLQLIQFCLVFIHGVQLLFIECDYPKLTLLFVLPNVIFFYYLFNDFYHKAYKEVDSPKSQQKFQNGTTKEVKVQ